MGYHVRVADAESARDHLLPLWAQNLPVRGALDEKLRWFYCDGPHGPGRAFVLHPDPDDGTAIGCAGIGVRTLWHHGEPRRAGLFADLAIDRTHRSGFPALALVRRVKDHALRELDLGYGFPNEKAAPVYRRSGYTELGEMVRYVRVLRSAPYLAPRLHVPWIARAIGTVVDGVLAAGTRIAAHGMRNNVELVWLADFDARFDRLWEEARDAYPLLCERGAEFLRWRFLRQPAHVYRIAALVERASRRVRAYAVISDAHGIAELADFFAADLRDLDRLVGALLPALYEAGFTAVSYRFLGLPEVPRVFAGYGFAKRGATRMVALAVADTTPRADELRDVNAWYLTDLDEDT